MFARPGFGPITGAAKKHIIFRVPLRTTKVAGNLIGCTMINLEITLLIFLKTYKTFGPALFN